MDRGGLEGGRSHHAQVPKVDSAPRWWWSAGGVIQKFSAAARVRLLTRLRQVVLTLIPHLITLTYSDIYPTDPREWKRELDKWLKQLRRACPRAAGFWKMELKPRQSGESKGEIAPHFHLLVWGLPETFYHKRGQAMLLSYTGQTQLGCTPTHKEWRREVYEDGKEIASSESGLSDVDRKLPVDRFVSRRRRANGVQRDVFEYWIRDGGAAHRSMIEGATKGREISLMMWVALTWAAAVGSGDPRHVRAGTQTVKVRTVEGVMSYAAKYMSK